MVHVHVNMFTNYQALMHSYNQVYIFAVKFFTRYSGDTMVMYIFVYYFLYISVSQARVEHVLSQNQLRTGIVHESWFIDTRSSIFGTVVQDRGLFTVMGWRTTDSAVYDSGRPVFPAMYTCSLGNHIFLTRGLQVLLWVAWFMSFSLFTCCALSDKNYRL